ncbi:hypothetical protein D3C85_623170 [compost metagenome]
MSNADHQKLEDQKEHYQSKIAIHKESLAKVPKGTKYNLRRQMLRDNIRDAEDKLGALVKSGKKAAAPVRKPRAKSAGEKALDRVNAAENKLIEYRQLKAQIAELQKQKVQTAGHTKRASIQKQIDALEAKKEALSPSK